MSDPYFPLGYPPENDPEGAARLLAEYMRQGKTGPEFGESFAMMVGDDLDAIVRRAEEILGE